jgi:nicotinamide riboside kinase
MKIGIMGTHGCSKTTLALRMASQHKECCPGDRVGILSEIARSCPWLLNENATWQAQAWLFHVQVAREIEESDRNDVLVCDRTVLDCLAYSKDCGFFGQVQSLMPYAREWLDTYDTIYFLRPNNTPISADGFRATDPAYQQRIDRILHAWVTELKLPVVEAKAGNG